MQYLHFLDAKNHPIWTHLICEVKVNVFVVFSWFDFHLQLQEGKEPVRLKCVYLNFNRWTNTNKFFAADKLLTGRLCQLWTRANTSLSREKLSLAKQREEISPWRLQCCSTNKTFEGSNKTMPDLNSRPKQPLRFLPNIGDKIYHKYITT